LRTITAAGFSFAACDPGVDSHPLGSPRAVTAPARETSQLFGPSDIDADGSVVGLCVTQPGLAVHGFLRKRSGSIELIDLPGDFAPNTQLSINERGEITGGAFSLSGDCTQRGFIRSPKGDITLF
jgi:hypothetical protein